MAEVAFHRQVETAASNNFTSDISGIWASAAKIPPQLTWF